MIELLWAIALERDYARVLQRYPTMTRLGYVRWRGYLSPHRQPPAAWTTKET